MFYYLIIKGEKGDRSLTIKSWVKKEEKLIFQKFGKWLRSVIFIDPYGKEQEFILFGQKDWVTIFALTPDNQVLTVRQFKQGCNKVIQELPAGTEKYEGEPKRKVAIRELTEETGYRAEEIVALSPAMWIASRNSPTRFYCFLATGCVKEREPRKDVSEEIEVQLVPLAEWVEMCYSEIEEPSAVVATFRALKALAINL